jgi:hypothetical protein
MLKITMSTAGVIALAAWAAIVPANADHLGGGPIHNPEGKCWKQIGELRDARYGFWADCPKRAAANAAASNECSIGQLAWEKAHVGLLYFDYCRAR